MSLTFSNHARARIEERGIAIDVVEAIVARPLVAGVAEGRPYRTGPVLMAGKRTWLTAILDPVNLSVVVTVYDGGGTAHDRTLGERWKARREAKAAAGRRRR